MYAGEDGLAVLEVEERGETFMFDQRLEEELGGVIGGDARGDDDADAARLVDEIAVELGEERVCVYSPSSTQRVAATITCEVAYGVVLAPRIEERQV